MRRPHRGTTLGELSSRIRFGPLWPRLQARCALVACGLLSLVASCASRAVTITPALEADAYHDAGSLRTLHPQGDVITLASPSLGVSLLPGAWRAQLSERASFQSYTGTA